MGNESVQVYFGIRGIGYRCKLEVPRSSEYGETVDFLPLEESRLAIGYEQGVIEIFGVCKLSSYILQTISLDLQDPKYVLSTIVATPHSDLLGFFVHEEESFCFRQMKIYGFDIHTEEFWLRSDKTFEDHEIRLSVIKHASFYFRFQKKPLLAIYQGFKMNEFRFYSVEEGGESPEFVSKMKMIGFA